MNKIAFILLLAVSLFGPLFAEGKTPVPCDPARGAVSCAVIPGRLALREGLLRDQLSQLKIKKKIEHSDLAVSALLLSAEHALIRGDAESAIVTAEKAIAFSSESPLPHFFLSHLYRLNNKESILRALGEYATGIRLSIKSFWLFTSSIGIIGLALLITFHLCLLTFLLYCFIRYTPLWVHFFKERLPASIHNSSILFVIAFFYWRFFSYFPLFGFFLFHCFSSGFFISQKRSGSRLFF